MCIMCLEILNDRMKASEVIKALGEFKVPDDHELELEAVIKSKFTEEELKEALSGK